MVRLGATPVGLKGDGPWRGMTTTSKSLPFHFTLLEDCYVSLDGNEIRTRPGWKCVLDPVSQGRTTGVAGDGYWVDTPDGARPTISAADASRWNLAPTSIHYTHAAPTHWHGFERVRDRWVIFGETDFRKDPLYDDTQTANVYVGVASYTRTSATLITLTLSAAIDSSAGDPNHIDVDDWVHLEGLTGTNASLLNGKTFQVTSIGGTGTRPAGVTSTTTVVIAASTTAGTGGTSQTGSIWRVTQPVVVGTDKSFDKESLTTWTVIDGFDVDATNPVSTVYPAHVANRIRDYGDDNAGTATTLEGTIGGSYHFSRRAQKEIPYRLVPDVTENRLLLAAPGYGCVFQAPVTIPINYSLTGGDADLGIDWIGNDIFDRPRVLGLPKPHIVNSPTNSDRLWGNVTNTPVGGGPAGGSDTWGGTSESSKEGVYKFQFTFYDPVTREESLPSETVSVDTTSGADTEVGIAFHMVPPGYLMHETCTVSVNVYRTKKNGDTFYFDRALQFVAWENTSTSVGIQGSKYGLDPRTTVSTAGTYVTVLRYEAIYSTDAELESRGRFVPTVINNMPMGCSAIRTIRGYTMFGGAVGNSGKDLELLTGTLSWHASPRYARMHTYKATLSAGQAPLGNTDYDTGFGVSATYLPSSYMGQYIQSRTLFDWPHESARVSKAVNFDDSATCVGLTNRGLYPATAPYLQYEFEFAPMITTPVDPLALECSIILPRDLLRISEPDNPGYSPATSVTTIANERDGGIEGIGEVDGQAIIATRGKAYYLGWSSSPVGVQPNAVKDRFSCISANSMVQFDGGCAWMSDRGPVAFINGGFNWIGAALESYFSGETSRYKRDSRGMMRHSWACHDAERGLLYFGMLVDENDDATITYRGASVTWASASDEARSRFPCDEVLVYNYRHNAWSVWKQPDGWEILWMTRGEDKGGNARVFMLLADGRIYALDDTYSQFNKEPAKTVLTAASTLSATVTVAAGSFATDRASFGLDNNHIRVGMGVAIDDPAGMVYSTIESFDVASDPQTVTLADTVTVSAGAVIYVGVRKATQKTTFANFKGPETAGIAAIGVRYTHWSRFANDTATGLPQSLWTRALVTVGRRVSQSVGDPPAETFSYTGINGQDGYTPMGVSVTPDAVFDRAFTRGAASGQNFALELVHVGGSQMRLHNLYADVK